MVNPQLAKWLKTEEAKGLNEQQLRQYLKQQNYSQKDINDVFNEMNSGGQKNLAKPILIVFGLIVLLFVGLMLVKVFSEEKTEAQAGSVFGEDEFKRGTESYDSDAVEAEQARQETETVPKESDELQYVNDSQSTETVDSKSYSSEYIRDKPYQHSDPLSVAGKYLDSIEDKDPTSFRSTSRNTLPDSMINEYFQEQKETFGLERDYEVLGCKDAQGNNIDCENPPSGTDIIKITVKGKNNNKQAFQITLQKDIDRWFETGTGFDYPPEETETTGDTAITESPKETTTEEDQVAETPETGAPDFEPEDEEPEFTYEDPQSYDSMNPLSVVDKYATAVINKNVEAYMEVLINSTFQMLNRSASDEVIEDMLERKKTQTFSEGFDILYCADVVLPDEINCLELPDGTEELRIYLEVTSNDVEVVLPESMTSDTIDYDPATDEIEYVITGTTENAQVPILLTLEEDGWKITG